MRFEALSGRAIPLAALPLVFVALLLKAFKHKKPPAMQPIICVLADNNNYYTGQ